MRLHWNDRPEIPEFSQEEKLYWRVKPGKKHDPPYCYFKEPTLSDISVNRSGQNNILSNPEDVLFGFTPAEPETYTNYDVAVFNIPSHEEVKIEHREGEYHLKLDIIHDPLDCNYPHSVFRFWLNDIVVTILNREETLHRRSGDGKKQLEILRMVARDHLHKLMIGHHQ